MKTKRFLSVVLAVIFTLSLGLVPAFASEVSHEHTDECGCSSTYALCRHPNTMSSITGEDIYKDDDTHYVNSYTIIICIDCSAVLSSTPLSSTTAPHNSDAGSSLESFTHTQDGRHLYIYRQVCTCGHIHYEPVDTECGCNDPA